MAIRQNEGEQMIKDLTEIKDELKNKGIMTS